ncbi:hypothetical protein M3P05_16045 [Sansalvadorimonas sp. 2012CJ34-2]|uniref:Uncharacterized protein n=1 Tax=Parendozoicomonas callyspongiae TaxID=2942213 RepID=A0ABT0PJC6_9GAMM|nr:hypothetical protein [Sansalvadorimonas sp. 2012CJ34-2]MCL6271433.1 hypothetical protein [Sansalvadorimonas sp. 2012CJ34-2]
MRNEASKIRQTVTPALIFLLLVSLLESQAHAGSKTKGDRRPPEKAGTGRQSQIVEMEETVEAQGFVLPDGPLYVPPTVKKAIDNRDWDNAIAEITRTSTLYDDKLSTKEVEKQQIEKRLAAEKIALADLEKIKKSREDKIDQQKNDELESIAAEERKTQALFAQIKDQVAEITKKKRQQQLAKIEEKEKNTRDEIARLKVLQDGNERLHSMLKKHVSDEHWRLIVAMCQAHKRDEHELIQLRDTLKASAEDEKILKADLEQAQRDHDEAVNAHSRLDTTYADKKTKRSEKIRENIKSHNTQKTNEELTLRTLDKTLAREREQEKIKLDKTIQNARLVLTKKPKVDERGQTATERLNSQIIERENILASNIQKVVSEASLEPEGDEIVADMKALTQRVTIRPFCCLPRFMNCCCKKFSPWLKQEIQIKGKVQTVNSYVPLNHGQWKSGYVISEGQTIITEQGIRYEVYIIQKNAAKTGAPHLFEGARFEIYAVPWAETIDFEKTKERDNTVICSKHGLLSIHMDSGKPINETSRSHKVTFTPLLSSEFDEIKYDLIAPGKVPSGSSTRLPTLVNPPGMKALKADGYLPFFNMSTFAHIAKRYLDARANNKVSNLVNDWSNARKQLELVDSNIRLHFVSWIRKEGKEYYYQEHRQSRWIPVNARASYFSTGITFTNSTSATGR